MRSYLTVLALALLALALPSAAFAADRYASPEVPAGGGNPAQCPEANPCNIYDAISWASDTNHDVVHLAAGIHTTEDILYVPDNVTVKGAGIDETRIETLGRVGVHLLRLGEQSNVMDLTIDASVAADSADRPLLGSSSGATVRRVAVYGGTHACTIYNGAISDSICVGGNVGIVIASNVDLDPVVRNVTALGSQYGLDAGQNAAASTTFVDAVNTIAIGGTADVRAYTALAANEHTQVKVELRNSNYSTTTIPDGISGKLAITSPGTAGNQTAEPLFIDAEVEDYRQADGSPTIDAGTEEASELGLLDVFGNPRIDGDGIDIGAHEFEVPDDEGEGGDGDNEGEGGDDDGNSQPGPILGGGSDGAPVGGPAGPGDGASSGGAADQTKPRIARLRVRPARFRVAGRRGAVQRAGASARTGARVTFALSEAARVRLTVQRARPGHRLGRKCLKPTPPRRATRKRCLRWVGTRGRIVHQGKAGTNRLRFNGRLKGRALPAGKYRLVAVAIDAAGNRSAIRRAAFRIVRR